MIRRYVSLAILVSLLVCSSAVGTQAQESSIDDLNREFLRDLLREPIETITGLHMSLSMVQPIPRYKLYKTENVWSFVLLDTATGRAWQVIYSVSDDQRSSKLVINDRSLIGSGEVPVPGRFSLAATENMWNFILLDQSDGRVWQLQYSTSGPSYRFIEAILPH